MPLCSSGRQLLTRPLY